MTFPIATGADVRRHELLAGMAESVARFLIEKHDIAEEAACDVGNALADLMADRWKGHTFYLPADQAYRLNQRDWEIFRRMERGTAPDLALEFGISTIRVYQIYKRCLVEYRARVQGSLFETESVPAERADR